ncbi:MAG: sigma-54 dependent transcriptional regulator [Verrucomicrobia bacterium]|nr:sigma-54-dependent Fis family transcriptional regulator [Verrucomicrobiota bacterium]MDA1045505.1 sigma-54 dependent transcriptional regulator [Verrucomicrobiota bacterium]
MPATILIVDDEQHTREGLELALEEKYDIYLASDPEEAFNLLDAEKFDIVLTDLRMSGSSGMSVIDHAIRMPNRPVCIMMTAYGDVDVAVEAMKRGAFDFLSKPLNLEKLEILIRRGLDSRNLTEENAALHRRLDKKYSFDGILGESSALEEVLEKVRLVAPSKASVLLQGETGTGKELIAQAIHQNSDRARGPYVPVHCAALPANLLESELFGHEKGAFTGAAERRIGRFEAADNGTLFLDEIGEIDPSTQVKLLRFLESKTIERLGSMKPIVVNARLVCATNRNLENMLKKGEFRDDLFYRLNVIRIQLPSLRERADDVPILLNHFLEEFAEENGLTTPIPSAQALSILRSYSWPGNVRELRNFCENMVVLKRGSEITEYDLDPRFSAPTDLLVDERSPGENLSVEENEKRLLRNALVRAGGNRTKAAELMGVSRRTLHRKLDRWPELDVREP